MFATRAKTPGLNRAPKMELVSTSGAYTQFRLYLYPVPAVSEIVFNQYDWDFTLAGASPNIDFKCAIYERNRGTSSKLSSSGTILTPVSGTSVTVTGQTVSFQTTALGSTKVLLPGHYYIAFIFDEQGTTILTSKNAHTNNTSVTGDWLYADQGSLTLPSTIAGTSLGYIHSAGECPFWTALSYTGDTIP